MKKFLFIFVFVLFSCSQVHYVKGVRMISSQTIPPELQGIVSTLEKESSPKERKKVIRKWADSKSFFPLINGKSVTFVYYHFSGRSGLENVRISGSFNGFATNDLMDQAGNLPLYYKTFEIENADGLIYHYLLRYNKRNRKSKDPFNSAISYNKPIQSRVHTPKSPKGTLLNLGFLKPAGINPKRPVFVYLPPGYFAETNRRYPVLYMQDGQNIWAGDAAAFGGWKVDQTATRLISKGTIEPLIIVGIGNTSQRNLEYIGYSAYYGYTKEDQNPKILQKAHEYAEGYRHFVTEELKPLIDRKFRTLPDRAHTGIAGSSFGAGVSLYIGFSRKDLFSKIGALSGGNYQPNDPGRREKDFFQVYPYLIHQVISKDDMKLYVDCGGMGVDMIFRPRTEDLHKALLKLGYKEGEDLFYQIDPKASHNEEAWAKRFPTFLKWMYSKEEKSEN